MRETSRKKKGNHEINKSKREQAVLVKQEARSAADGTGAGSDGTDRAFVQNAKGIQSPDSLKETEKHRKKMPGVWRLLLTLIGVVLFLLLALYLVFLSYYSKLDHTEAVEETAIAPIEEEIERIDPSEASVSVVDDAWEYDGKRVINILLIGEDNDDLEYMDSRGNADGLVIASINKDTRQVVITSLLRDTSVNVQDQYRAKLTMSYHYGGTEVLLDTIQRNFGVPIDNYVLINYFSLIEIIDAFGGVTLEVSPNELYGMESKIKNLDMLVGNPYGTSEIPIEDAGIITMNGIQTAAYLRIRNTESADHERTERLRKVLGQLREKASEMSLSELNNVANTVLPLLRTDLSQADILMLLSTAQKILHYDFISQRIPLDGTYESRSLLGLGPVVDYRTNSEYLYYTIYEGHEPPHD